MTTQTPRLSRCAAVARKRRGSRSARASQRAVRSADLVRRSSAAAGRPCGACWWWRASGRGGSCISCRQRRGCCRRRETDRAVRLPGSDGGRWWRRRGSLALGSDRRDHHDAGRSGVSSASGWSSRGCQPLPQRTLRTRPGCTPPQPTWQPITDEIGGRGLAFSEPPRVAVVSLTQVDEAAGASPEIRARGVGAQASNGSDRHDSGHAARSAGRRMSPLRCSIGTAPTVGDDARRAKSLEWWRGRRWTVQLVHVPAVYLGGTGAASAASVSFSETTIKP
jgi:hypothetical protein